MKDFALYIAALVLSVWFVRTGVLEWTPTQLTMALIAESAILIAISWYKGEKPSWSWGSDR